MDDIRLCRPFKHETGQAVLDVYFAGYDELTVGRMRRLLDHNEIASNLLRAMYAGPELIFPVLLTTLLLLVLMRLRPSGSHFNRPISPSLIALVYVLPVIYGLADYGENICQPDCLRRQRLGGSSRPPAAVDDTS